jgi:glycine cleavage system aminomethyltransferase T
VGELGYELHVPTEFALHVYDRVMQVGEQYGLVHAGLKALGSLRLEKAYRDYGHDMDNMDRYPLSLSLSLYLTACLLNLSSSHHWIV